MKGLRRLLPTLAVIAALSLGLTTVADAYSGSGALWSMARGEYYLTNRAGNSTGLSAAYTALGSDGYHQVGPGLEALDLTGLPVGQNILRTTYQGIDFLGRPFRVYDGQLTKRLQVDSLGAALTGALTVSTTLDVTGNVTGGGKAVFTDSLRVGNITTLNKGLTVQGGNITLAGDLALTGSTGDGISFASATSGASITNNAAAKLQLGGRANATTLVLNNSGSRDVVVNGDLEAADSLTTAGSLIVDGAATIAGNSWVAGRWTVGDSLRVFEAANFDGGIKATGASWVSGTVDVGDTLRAAVGIRSVGDVDVSTGNVVVKSGNGYRIRDTGGTSRSVMTSSGTDDLNLLPLASGNRINLKGTTLATGFSIHPVNGDAWLASSLTVGDSLEVGRDFGGPIISKGKVVVEDSLRVNEGLYAGANYLAKLDAGTYSPTRSSETNMDSNVTMTTAQYSRVGSVVTVSGRFTADPTSASTFTGFSFTLPVSSDFAAAEEAAGVALCGVLSGVGAQITGDVASNVAVVRWTTGADVASQTWTYTFTYQIK